MRSSICMSLIAFGIGQVMSAANPVTTCLFCPCPTSPPPPPPTSTTTTKHCTRTIIDYETVTITTGRIKNVTFTETSTIPASTDTLTACAVTLTKGPCPTQYIISTTTIVHSASTTKFLTTAPTFVPTTITTVIPETTTKNICTPTPTIAPTVTRTTVEKRQTGTTVTCCNC